MLQKMQQGQQKNNNNTDSNKCSSFVAKSKHKFGTFPTKFIGNDYITSKSIQQSRSFQSIKENKMLSVVITSFQFGLCSRKILENETNIESFGCVIKNDEEVTLIPFYPCYLNGSVIEAETRIYNGDLLSVNDIAIKINIAKMEEIDLTDDSTNKLDSGNNLAPTSPKTPNQGFYFASTHTSEYMDIENSASPNYSSSDHLQEPRTPNYGHYFNLEDSMDLDDTTSDY